MEKLSDLMQEAFQELNVSEYEQAEIEKYLLEKRIIIKKSVLILN